MDIQKFKITLCKLLEKELKEKSLSLGDGFADVVRTLPNYDIDIEYTGKYSYRGWNTYSAYLHIRVPLEMLDTYEVYREEIFNAADRIHGKTEESYIVAVVYDLMCEDGEIPDFSHLALNKVIEEAILNAETLMVQGKYADAFDRVHTGFTGFLRQLLVDRGIAYEESDSLNKLYSKLHSDVVDKITDEEQKEMVRSIVRACTGAISKINDARNHKSLAHPNGLLGEDEATLALKFIKNISEYISIKI